MDDIGCGDSFKINIISIDDNINFWSWRIHIMCTRRFWKTSGYLENKHDLCFEGLVLMGYFLHKNDES